MNVASAEKVWLVKKPNERRYMPATCLPGYHTASGHPAAPHNLSVSDPAIGQRATTSAQKIQSTSRTSSATIPPPPRLSNLPRPNMVLKLRLARFGRTNAPFYNIVVAHARYAIFPSLRHAQLPANSLTSLLEPRATASLSRSLAHTIPFPRRTRTTPQGSCIRTLSWTSRGPSTG